MTSTPKLTKSSFTRLPTACTLTPTSLREIDCRNLLVDSRSRTSSWIADQQSSCHDDRTPSRSIEHFLSPPIHGMVRSGGDRRHLLKNAHCLENIKTTLQQISSKSDHCFVDETKNKVVSKHDILYDQSPPGLLGYNRDCVRNLRERRRNEELINLEISSGDDTCVLPNLNRLSHSKVGKNVPGFSRSTELLVAGTSSDNSEKFYSPNIELHHRPFIESKRERIPAKISCSDMGRRSLGYANQHFDMATSFKTKRTFDLDDNCEDYKPSRSNYSVPHFSTSHNIRKSNNATNPHNNHFSNPLLCNSPLSLSSIEEPLDSRFSRNNTNIIADQFTKPKQVTNGRFLSDTSEDDDARCFKFRNETLNRTSRLDSVSLNDPRLSHRLFRHPHLLDPPTLPSTRTIPNQDIYSTPTQAYHNKTDDVLEPDFHLHSSRRTSNRRNTVDSVFIAPTLSSLDQRIAPRDHRTKSFVDPVMQQYDMSNYGIESESFEPSALSCFNQFHPNKEKSSRNIVGTFFRK